MFGRTNVPEVDYLQSFRRTEEEMAKKRPKKPKIVKNGSFSPNS